MRWRLRRVEAVADDLVQAVDEAACNVMLHGYGGAPGEIEIEASSANERSRSSCPTAPTVRPDRGACQGRVAAAGVVRPGGMGVGIHLSER